MVHCLLVIEEPLKMIKQLLDMMKVWERKLDELKVNLGRREKEIERKPKSEVKVKLSEIKPRQRVKRNQFGGNWNNWRP